MTFEKFYILQESKFSQRKDVIPLFNFPMFSVYFKPPKNFPLNDDIINRFKNIEPILKDAFAKARNQITHIGFPSMHVNVIFENYKNLKWVEPSTAGYAVGNPRKKTQTSSKEIKQSRHISLNLGYLMGLEKDSNTYSESLIKTIVHEWSHVWMYNYGKRLSTAMKRFYDNIMDSQEDAIYNPKLKLLRKKIEEFKPSIFNIFSNNIDIRKTIDIIDRKLTNFATHMDIPEKSLFYISNEIMEELNTIYSKNMTTIQKNQLWNSFIEQLDIYGAIQDVVKTDMYFDMVQSGQWDEKISDAIQWSRSYGMKNIDELWATGIDAFSKLPKEHQKRIIQLMSETY